MFRRNKYSHSTTKSNQLFSPSTAIGKSQIQHNESLSIGLSFLNFYFLTESISKKFGLISLENQSFRVSMVNFSSTENNSAKEVDFSQASTAEAASFIDKK